MTERSDCVQDLPAAILPFVLAVVASDAKTARENLTPAAMACASPRVFWAVVRHGNVGPIGRTFTEALRSLTMGVADWDALTARARAEPSLRRVRHLRLITPVQVGRDTDAIHR